MKTGKKNTYKQTEILEGIQNSENQNTETTVLSEVEPRELADQYTGNEEQVKPIEEEQVKIEEEQVKPTEEEENTNGDEAQPLAEPKKTETRGRKKKDRPNDEQARNNAFKNPTQAAGSTQPEKATTQQLIFLDGETLVGLIDLGGQAAGVLLGKVLGKKIKTEDFALTENEKKAIEKPAHEVGKDLYLTPVQTLALALTSIYYSKYANLK